MTSGAHGGISPRGKKVIGVLVLLNLLGIGATYAFSRSSGEGAPNWDEHYARLEADRQGNWSPEASISVSEIVRWPTYRGAHGDGTADSTPILDQWPDGGPKEIYRRAIGGGYAGFVIDAGRAFTIEQRGDQEVISAYALSNGEEIWTQTYDAHFQERLGGPGPRATPTSDGEFLYVLGATGVLSAVSVQDGALKWQTNILTERGMKNLQYGMSGSPLRVNDLVIVHTSGENGPGVVAYKANTGELVWEGPVRKQGYASLSALELLGRTQIVNLAGTELVGLDPANGAELWRFPWDTWNGLSCAQPLKVSENQVFVSTGYGQGAALVELVEAADGISATASWTGMSMKNKFNNSVLIDGVVYGLDEGRLSAVEVATGKRLWKDKSYGYGQLVAADGKLVILGEKGELALVNVNPNAFEEVSSVQALSGRTWNNLALAGGILLVRNATEMVAYDLRK